VGRTYSEEEDTMPMNGAKDQRNTGAKVALTIIATLLLLTPSARGQASPSLLPEFYILSQGGTLPLEGSVSDTTPKDYYSLLVFAIGQGNLRVAVEKEASVPGETMGVIGAAVSFDGGVDPIIGLLSASTKLSDSVPIGTRGTRFGLLFLHVALLNKGDTSVPPYSFTIDLDFSR
jgi:hypothetical protein